MNDDAIEGLVSDAELIADAGTRMGRFPNPAPLLAAITDIRVAQEAKTVTPALVANLQQALNQAVPALSPVTLNDLKGGWRPYGSTWIGNLTTWVFVLICAGLLLLTAWVTLIYDRSVAQLNTAIELQGPRAQELAINIFYFIKNNNLDALTKSENGGSNPVRDHFINQFGELNQINAKILSYEKIRLYIEKNLTNPFLLFESIFSPSNLDRDSPIRKNFEYVGEEGVGQHVGKDQNLGRFVKGEIREEQIYPTVDYIDLICPGRAANRQEASAQSVAPVKPVLGEGGDPAMRPKSYCQLDVEFTDVKNLMKVLRVGIDPRDYGNFIPEIFRIQAKLVILGNWLIPALYGMLGAVIFFLRRFLNPTYPNPSLVALVYRVVLGGFVGIVTVWLWVPAAQNLSQPTFASLTAFGLAFIVGFSTDIFFQGLDRLVTSVSEAIGGKSATA